MAPAHILLLGLLTGLATGGSAALPPGANAALADADALAAAAVEEQRFPGVALVVMRGDDVVLARGYGREDATRADAVTPRTLFMLNSISKQLVAAAVLQLVEEGRIALEDPVARHLPEFTALPPGLEVRHLLAHTSGLREEHRQPELAALFARPETTFAEYVEVARHTPADFAPGSRWSYSNVNYLLLTVLLERLERAPLETVLASRLITPLRLRSFRLCPSQLGGAPGEARGHVRRDGALVPHPPENVALFRGSGGFCGDALDLARWTRALATGRAISERSYRLMTAPAPLTGGRSAEYGFAMSLASPDGVRRNGHGGYGGGFSAQAAYYPDAELTVVVMTNRFAFPEHLERKISRRLLGRPEPALVDVPLSPGERRLLAGSFDVGVHGWPVRVVEREERLWFSLLAPPIEFPLRHVGGRELVSALDPDGYRLSFSADGSELRLLGMGLMTWYGRREPSPDGAAVP